VPLRELRREAAVELEEPDGVTTVAGLCTMLAGGVLPARGARLASRAGAVIEVLEISPRAVRRVRVLPALATPPA